MSQPFVLVNPELHEPFCTVPDADGTRGSTTTCMRVVFNAADVVAPIATRHLSIHKVCVNEVEVD